MSSVDVAEVSQEGVGCTDETSVFSSYSKRLISLRSELGIAQSARSRSLLMIAGCICLAVLLIGLAPTHHAPSLLWCAAPLLGACYSLRRYIRSGAQWRKLEKRCEYRRRQEAVRELREGAGLREEMDLLGDFRAENCGSSAFEAWLDLAPIASPAVVRPLLLLSSTCTVVIGLGIFSHALAWSVWLPFMLALIAIQTGAAGIYVRRVRPRLGQLRRLTNAFTILQQGLELMEKQEFQSPKLREMVTQIQSQKASSHLNTLERLVRLVEQREKEIFYYLSFLLAGGTHLVLAISPSLPS